MNVAVKLDENVYLEMLVLKKSIVHSIYARDIILTQYMVIMIENMSNYIWAMSFFLIYEFLPIYIYKE